MFDPKCYDLAKYFLPGETPNASHSLDELAQEIQDAVEDYLIGKREAAAALSANGDQKMEPHEQRVVDEKQALDEKILKLYSFIASSPIFNGLDKHDRDILRNQYAAMARYSNLLGQRILRFSV